MEDSRKGKAKAKAKASRPPTKAPVSQERVSNSDDDTSQSGDGVDIGDVGREENKKVVINDKPAAKAKSGYTYDHGKSLSSIASMEKKRQAEELKKVKDDAEHRPSQESKMTGDASKQPSAESAALAKSTPIPITKKRREATFATSWEAEGREHSVPRGLDSGEKNHSRQRDTTAGTSNQKNHPLQRQTPPNGSRMTGNAYAAEDVKPQFGNSVVESKGFKLSTPRNAYNPPALSPPEPSHDGRRKTSQQIFDEAINQELQEDDERAQRSGGGPQPRYVSERRRYETPTPLPLPQPQLPGIPPAFSDQQVLLNLLSKPHREKLYQTTIASANQASGSRAPSASADDHTFDQAADQDHTRARGSAQGLGGNTGSSGLNKPKTVNNSVPSGNPQAHFAEGLAKIPQYGSRGQSSVRKSMERIANPSAFQYTAQPHTRRSIEVDPLQNQGRARQQHENRNGNTAVTPPNSSPVERNAGRVPPPAPITPKGTFAPINTPTPSPITPVTTSKASHGATSQKRKSIAADLAEPSHAGNPNKRPRQTQQPKPVRRARARRTDGPGLNPNGIPGEVRGFSSARRPLSPIPSVEPTFAHNSGLGSTTANILEPRAPRPYGPGLAVANKNGIPGEVRDFSSARPPPSPIPSVEPTFARNSGPGSTPANTNGHSGQTGASNPDRRAPLNPIPVAEPLHTEAKLPATPKSRELPIRSAPNSPATPSASGRATTTAQTAPFSVLRGPNTASAPFSSTVHRTTAPLQANPNSTTTATPFPLPNTTRTTVPAQANPISTATSQASSTVFPSPTSAQLPRTAAVVNNPVQVATPVITSSIPVVPATIVNPIPVVPGLAVNPALAPVSLQELQARLRQVQQTYYVTVSYRDEQKIRMEAAIRRRREILAQQDTQSREQAEREDVELEIQRYRDAQRTVNAQADEYGRRAEVKEKEVKEMKDKYRRE